MELDVIIVLLVFIGFCVGSAVLITRANKELKNQEKRKINGR